jgi:hypothetical protein
MRAASTVLAILIVTLAVPTSFAEETPEAHLALFNRMLLGARCEGTPDNGLHCKYKLGTLEVSIGDVGGTDTVIAFNHSDSEEEFYAVMFSGCIAIIPTRSEVAKHDHNFGVFISPFTGKIYMTPKECIQAGSGS